MKRHERHNSYRAHRAVIFALAQLSCEITYNVYALVESLCSGRFHNHLRDVFAPHVVRYVDLMESSIAQSIHKGFEKESWKSQGSVSCILSLYSGLRQYSRVFSKG